MPLNLLAALQHEEGETSNLESPPVPEITRLRNKVRTEKARTVALLARQQQKTTQACSEEKITAEEKFCKEWYHKGGKRDESESGYQWELQNKQRHLAVFSYLAAMVQQIIAVFVKMGSSHLILTSVVHDAELLMHKASGDRRAKVPTMNIIQHAYIRSLASPSLLSFQLHVAMQQLEGTKAPNLYNQWVASLLYFGGVVGVLFAYMGLLPEHIRCCQFVLHVCCTDALSTNISKVNKAKECMHRMRVAPGSEDFPVELFLHILCFIHQWALMRKIVCLCIPGFWTNLVRLGHLFESATFRSKFSEAVIQVVAADFHWHRVAQLPPEVDQWKQFRRKQLKVDKPYSEISHTVRLDLSVILNLDNGDPESKSFVHWCDGCCSSLKDALSLTADAYKIRFGKGFLVPLLQRWKHGPQAQKYAEESSQSLIFFIFPVPDCL